MMLRVLCLSHLSYQLLLEWFDGKNFARQCSRPIEGGRVPFLHSLLCLRKAFSIKPFFWKGLDDLFNGEGLLYLQPESASP